VVSELSPAPSLLVCTMNTGWKRLQHEKRAKVAQRMLFAEHRVLRGIGSETGFAESDPEPLAPAPSVLANLNLNGQIAVLFHFSDKPTNQALTTLSVNILTAAGRLCGRVRRSAR